IALPAPAPSDPPAGTVPPVETVPPVDSVPPPAAPQPDPDPPLEPEEPPVDPEEPPVDPDPAARDVEYLGPVDPEFGSGILFHGTGFAPGARVSLQIEGTTTVSTIDANEEGSFTANLPTPEPGDHVLIVSDGLGELRVPFTVSAPGA